MMLSQEVDGLVCQGIRFWTDLGGQQIIEEAIPFAKSFVGLLRQGGFEAVRQAWSGKIQEEPRE